MKKKSLNWTQNIECIFTKEELNKFVKEGYLEKVWRTDRYYHIKKGCKKWFQCKTPQEGSSQTRSI